MIETLTRSLIPIHLEFSLASNRPICHGQNTCLGQFAFIQVIPALHVFPRAVVAVGDANAIGGSFRDWRNVMKKYVIEREVPAIGSLTPAQLHGAAAKSCEALNKIGTDVQWIESFVTADKTFCIYLAENEAAIRRHSELSGFPANKITAVTSMLDPTMAG
jgi:Protein of unknown function (DUF4242)